MVTINIGRVVGQSAYEVAQNQGYEGTEAQWIESLRLQYSDLTDQEILDLQAPATEAAAQMAEAEALRVIAEEARVEAEEQRINSVEQVEASLELKIDKSSISQASGRSTSEVMSQAAVTTSLHTYGQYLQVITTLLTFYTSSQKLTLPANTMLYGVTNSGGEFWTTLSSAVTIDLSSVQYNTHYVIAEMTSSTSCTLRAVAAHNLIELGDSEALLCKIRKNTGVLEMSAYQYMLNDSLIDFVPTAKYVTAGDLENYATKEEMESYQSVEILSAPGTNYQGTLSQGFLTNYINASSKYLQVMNGELSLNTSTRKLTIPSGTLLYGSKVDYSVTNSIFSYTLTEDYIVDLSTDSASSYYIICKYINSQFSVRFVTTGGTPILYEGEAMLCKLRKWQAIIDANIFSYYLDDTPVTLIPTEQYATKGELGNYATKEELTAVEPAKPRMFNPPLNLQKSTLKVLDIGNSYTQDATSYLSDLVSASGIDVSDMALYTATRGSASYKTWCDTYFDADTAGYTISKVAGTLTTTIETGNGAAGNGELFRACLSDESWDLIIIHQVSTYAPYYDQWNEDSNAGELDKLIQIIRKHQPQATIGFTLVHSYASNYESNSENSSLERWRLIADSASRLRNSHDIDFVIPYGTAIQNLRSSSLNTINSATGHYNDFTSDGTHCASGLGDYVASCCYFQSLLAPRYGKSILGNSFNSVSVSESGTTYQGAVSVTPTNSWTAQKAAFIASYNWYENINPEDVELGENPFI